MPEWLISVLVQFPMVVVIGLVAWYATNRIERNSEASIRREDGIRAKADADLKAAHRELIEAKDADIKRLHDDIRDEMKKLGKKVDELTKRLGGDS